MAITRAASSERRCPLIFVLALMSAACGNDEEALPALGGDAAADAGLSATDAGATYAPPEDSALADYERAFPQDRVPRLDIIMSTQSYQSLQDDMTGMLGEFGAGGGFGGPGMGMGMGGFMLPEALFTACASLAAGDGCEGTIFGMPLAGTCTADAASGRLMCRPSGFPGGGGMMAGMGGFGLGSVDLIPETPIYAECEVRVDGLAWKHVGFRYKGNSSLAGAWGRGVGKLPFRLKFDEYEDLYPESQNQRYFGFQLLSFSNGQGDASLMRGKLAADVFAQAGIGTARSAFYRVFLDRGAGPIYLGLYSVSELPQDDAFLERAFGSKAGNLYKPDGQGARWQSYDEGSLEKETNEEQADFSDAKALYDALHADRSDPAAWRAGLEARFNTDLFLRWLAVNTVIQDWDQYGQMPHNYYLYANPNDGGRFAWIPWDHSLSMQAGFGGGGPGGGAASVSLSEVTEQWPLIRYLLDDGVYRQIYRDHVEATIGGAFAPAATIARFRAAHALIAPYVIGVEGEQPGYTLLSSPAEFEQSIEQLAAHVESRAQAVAEFLATP